MMRENNYYKMSYPTRLSFENETEIKTLFWVKIYRDLPLTELHYTILKNIYLVGKWLERRLET